MMPELHPYQERGKKWIIEHEKCGLFFQMGAGKTLTTLAALDELMNDRFEIEKVLIIGPKRVITSTWPDEIEKWGFDLKYSIVAGTREQREKALKKPADIFLIGKENVVWLIEHLGRRWDFDMVVVDELSTFKNPQAKRFKALRQMSYRRFVGLTGTPSPKGIPDLWSQLYLMDRGERLFPSITKFRSTWLTPVSSNGYVVYKYGLRSGAQEEIQRRISDICMSLNPKEYSSLPAIRMIETAIRVPDDIKEQYREFKRDLITSVDGGVITASNAGVLSGKLIQFTSGEIYDEDRRIRTVHDLKIERLMRLIEEADGEPVIIYYWYQHERDRIISELEKAKLKFSELKNRDEIRQWNAGDLDCLLLHPASAGHGLNLQQGGHIAVWYTLPNWSLECYDQANARVYRQGQKEKVQIYHLLLDDTIDGDMLKALRGKKDIQEKLLEALRK